MSDLIPTDIRVRGLAKVQAKLEAEIPMASPAVRRAGHRDIGFHVQKVARRNAPFREGDLERSIDFRFDVDSCEIFVGLNTAAGSYAKWQHDDLDHEPGPGTKAKQGAGPKYITRAVRSERKKLVKILQFHYKKII